VLCYQNNFPIANALIRQLRRGRCAYYARLAVPDISSQLPAEPQSLAAALSRYLGAGIEHLRVLASGWETTLYEFELSGPSAMLPELKAGVAVGAAFLSKRRGPPARAHWSIARFSHLASAGYPVPRPYVFEPGGAAIGAPFLVMERLGGGPLFAIRSFSAGLQDLLDGLSGIRARASQAASDGACAVRTRIAEKPGCGELSGTRQYGGTHQYEGRCAKWFARSLGSSYAR